MHPQRVSRRQFTLAPFLLSALFVTLCVVGVVSGTGQSRIINDSNAASREIVRRKKGVR